jgi:precorrin-4/cobalt-precorrin-4 C11-methyltransferase
MTYQPQTGTVYFIGAGPGAPDLITVRGRDIISAADLVIYADSLVDGALAQDARPGTRVVGSSNLTLEEMTTLMVEAARQGAVVARLQSGDPAVYGAMHEQMAALQAADVPYTVIPGVSSAFAAAAALGVELTVPEVSQTVIFTRAQGRASAVPERESLRSLASHGASLALFLSAAIIDRAVADLLAGGYQTDTPAAIAYRVTWPDERVIACTLGEVERIVRAEKMTKSALILVGDALAGPAGAAALRSRLYDGTYTHLFRTGARE